MALGNFSCMKKIARALNFAPPAAGKIGGGKSEHSQAHNENYVLGAG